MTVRWHKVFGDTGSLAGLSPSRVIRVSKARLAWLRTAMCRVGWWSGHVELMGTEQSRSREMALKVSSAQWQIEEKVR